MARSKKRRSPNKMSRNNLQDRFADREFNKGYKSAIDVKSSDNDPKWYIPTGQMAKDVASFPTAYSVGAPIKRGTYKWQGKTFATSLDVSLPGVLALKLMPTVGCPTSPEDPVNVAMNIMFRDIRSATSGTSYYEAQDLMMYILAVGNLYSWYAHLVRAYGTLNTYSILNRYVPDALLEAMGFDADDLRTNAANFRTYINTFALKLASFALPNNLYYIVRQIFAFENVYQDADTTKAQYYLYRPHSLFKYVVVQSAGSMIRSIESVEVPETLTYQNMVNFTEDLVNAVIQVEDIRYMSADILKKYGSNLFKVSQIADGYAVSPVYNSEVLTQFENAFIFNEPTSYVHTISQNVGINNAYIFENIQLMYDEDSPLPRLVGALSEWRRVINFHRKDATPEDILVATRLSLGSIGVDPANLISISVNSCGSEIAVGATLYTYIASTTGLELQATSLGSIEVASGSQQTIEKIGNLSRFDWAPMLSPVMVDTPAPGLYAFNQPVFDIENYVLIEPQEMELINTNALLGELIPNDANIKLV